MISAPTANSGPIMERRPDRALPEIPNHSRRWLRTAPIFVAVCVVSCLAIFNYQKASSAVVNATLYSLRTHPRARELLGDEIYFRDRFPWIWGEMNQLHGRIDIGFGVKGTVGRGYMKFRSFRRSRMGYVSFTSSWACLCALSVRWILGRWGNDADGGDIVQDRGVEPGDGGRHYGAAAAGGERSVWQRGAGEEGMSWLEKPERATLLYHMSPIEHERSGRAMMTDDSWALKRGGGR